MTKESFVNLLNCWIKGDIFNMLQIKSNNDCGGCNFPIVLFTLSCMEWLGFLLRNCGPSKTQLEKTAENIDGCLDYFPSEYQNTLIRNIIKTLFRNGLVHQFGPKYAGISRGNYLNPPVKLMPNTFAPFLDADQLATNFIKVIDTICEKINKKEIDFDRIKEKLDFIFSNDRKEFQKLIVMLTVNNK